MSGRTLAGLAVGLTVCAAQAPAQGMDPVTLHKLLCAAVGATPTQCPAVSVGEAEAARDRIAEVVRRYHGGAVGALAAIRQALGLPPGASANDAELVEEVARRLEAAGIKTLPPDAGKFLPLGPVSHPDPNVLERSQLYPLFKGNILDAQIALHIFFYDNFSRLSALPEGGVTSYHRSAFAWSFTPLIRVRIRNVPSGPIKTLSWMPKTDFQWVRLWRKKTDPPIEERPLALTLQFVTGHHSNGQDECTYIRGVADGDPACVEPKQISDVRINYPNGSFSTNYFRFGLSLKRIKLGAMPTPTGTVIAPRQTHSGTLSFEVHPQWLKIGGTLPDIQRPLYGTNRVRGQYEFETRVGRPKKSPLLRGSFRFTGSVEYIDKITDGPAPTSTVVPGVPLNEEWNPGRGSSRFRFVAEAAWNPDALRGWGLQARYLHGQDPYNLLYIRDIHWFQAGIVFDAGEFQRFLTPGSK